MRDTSRKAYHELVESGLLGERQREAYVHLRQHGPCTAQELERAVGVERSQYGRRLSELLDPGLAETAGKRKCGVTGRTAMVWRAKRAPNDGPPPRTVHEHRAQADAARRLASRAVMERANRAMRKMIEERRRG